MTARALILNEVFGFAQGLHMTNFADIKSKIADW